MQKFSKKKKFTINEALLQRELKRVFPNLNVNPIMIDECYTGVPGHQYYKKETDFVKSELKIDNNHLILKVENIDTSVMTNENINALVGLANTMQSDKFTENIVDTFIKTINNKDSDNKNIKLVTSN